MTNAAAVIRQKTPNFSPRVGLILGTGLGALADSVENAQIIPYEILDGFPHAKVAGHAGRLVLGNIGKNPVVVCQGRAHYYENGDAAAMKGVIRTLKKLGCNTLLLTNAAGSLIPDAGPGSVVLLNDHINYTGMSPLFGESGNTRFVDLVDAYDPALREQFQKIAVEHSIQLHEGVYMWFCGPHFETPAEIRMARALGADAVGMSTVPEVILAREVGMKVAALSVITNMAAGINDSSLSHEQTLANADEGARKIQQLITTLLENNEL